MTTARQHHQTSLFSRKTYWEAITLLTLTGMALSVYLVLSHYRNFTDMGYQSFCAISRSLNCDTVSQSPYAVLWGVPVALWGALGYLFFFTLQIWLWFEGTSFSEMALLCLVAVIFCMTSIALALVSSFLVKSYCLMCMATYAVNFALLLLTWLARRRFGGRSFFADLKAGVLFLFERPVQPAVFGLAFVFLITALHIYYPKYWHFSIATDGAEIHHGITQNNLPYIGAETPLLTIEEFSDYMCFQCGKMHSHLRQLVAKYPDKIRLVHRQYPLDRIVNPMVKDDFHHQSSLLSLLALYAADQDKFWPVNDILFREARQKKAFDFNAIAAEAGLDLSQFKRALNSEKLLGQLSADIRKGLKKGITVTPSFLIDGKLYAGMIPEEVFAPIFKGDN